MKAKRYFDEVDVRINFPQLEESVLKGWNKNGVVKKYLNKNKSCRKYYSFLDGPITANNPMGVHHAWGRTYKDLWQRYKNMKGFKQRFQNGFDCQGLWVEVEVEKELGIKNKKDIEKYGVEKFVQKCKDRVKKYSGIQTEQSKRLGYFMDWDNSYFTLSDDNNYLIWHFLKVVDENGWLYKGSGSVPWCPRCETAISQHEILTEDYKDLDHESIIMEFPIVGRKKEFLLVWTTTPWTIPANVAVAVDEKIKYSLIKGKNDNLFWVASEAVKKVFGEKIKPEKEIRGKDLVGWKYNAPFDNLPIVRKTAKENMKKFHTVVATDERIMPISTEEGTGFVHTAVGAGTEDYKLGQKLKLPLIEVIDNKAFYLDGFGFLTGKNAKNNPRIILDYLKKEDKKTGVDWVFSIFKFKHRYPVCWRCKSELVWKMTDEWYVAMDKPSKIDPNSKTLRRRMIDVAKKIEWMPEFGLKREIDWLENMQDWLISKKNRYWGLTLPIWECDKCGKFEVIGSREELKKRAVSGWKDFEGKSPHKPQVDKIKIKCSFCGSISSRVEPVGNPWLDAGIVAYSTVSRNNKACQFRATNSKPLYLQNKKEWENWFPADFITESFPGQFKNWFYSLIAMSTVLEKRPSFKRVLGFATLLDEKGDAMHKSAGNMIEFYKGAGMIGVDVMRWMFARQKPSDNLFFGFKSADNTRRKVHIKLWNVYNFFVTNANIDGWVPVKNTKVGENVLDKWITSRLVSTSNDVEKSLDGYRANIATEKLEAFLDDLSNWYIRRSRDRVGPNFLTSKSDKNDFYTTTFYVLTNFLKLCAPVMPFMTDAIYGNLTKEKSIHLSCWPLHKTKPDKKLEKEMQEARFVVETIHSERKSAGISLKKPLNKATVWGSVSKIREEILDLICEEVNIKNIVFKKGREKVELDTKITEELRQEAKTRELIREIQNKRKEMKLELDTKIEVSTPWFPKDESQRELLKKKTLTAKLHRGETLKLAPLK